jgi:hypothetical protein
MATPSMIASRRISQPMRLRLRVTFAKAWEALAETYRLQAAEFVSRLLPLLPVEEALDRFFREVGVPASMTDTVRARALVALAPLFHNAAAAEEATAPPGSWMSLRPDQLFGALRQRVQYVEETNLQSRLAACVADEALATTHVRMALETAETLAAEVTPDEAIMHYVRTFDLPALEAQIIFQRAMAQWAERHSAAPQPAAAVADERESVCASAPRLELVATM